MKPIGKYKYLALLMSLLVFAACASPAGVPAPPVEVPSPIVLKFVDPNEINIDVTAISSTPTLSLSKALAPGELASALIQLGPDQKQAIDINFITPAFDNIGVIEMPVGETVTTYSADIAFPASTSGVPARLSGLHHVDLNFADYDFDDDGVTEGCSGHTAQLPVCVRFWLDGERYLAWVFDEYPYEATDPNVPGGIATIGKGRFKSLVPQNEFGLTVRFGVNYAQVLDPASRASEFFMLVDRTGERTYVCTQYELFCAFVDNYLTINYHLNAADNAHPDGILKDIALHNRVNYRTETGIDGDGNKIWADEGEFNFVDYLGRYITDTNNHTIEGKDYWSGSVAGEVNTGGAVIPYSSNTNTCADISTGFAVELGFCDALGISVGEEPYIRATTEADVNLPTNFPAAPI